MLLDRERLDEVENNPIFTLWLFGSVDENTLTEEDKMIIFARQMYYDLILSDAELMRIVDRTGAVSLEDLISDRNKLITGSLLSKVPAYVINTKATLCIKRLEQYNRRNSKNL